MLVWGLVSSTRNSQRGRQPQEWRSRCWDPGWALQGPWRTQARWPRCCDPGGNWHSVSPGPLVTPRTSSVRSGACQTPGPCPSWGRDGWHPRSRSPASPDEHHQPLGLLNSQDAFVTFYNCISLSGRNKFSCHFSSATIHGMFQLCQRERTLWTLLCWERSASV